jgi:hypothetical protein
MRLMSSPRLLGTLAKLSTCVVEGKSLEVALASLQREIYECRVVHEGPTDARLCCDGKLVETERDASGRLRVATKPRANVRQVSTT